MSEAPRTDLAYLPFERRIQEVEKQLAELEQISARTKLDISSELEALRTKLQQTIGDTYRDLSAWERVCVARHDKRPIALDYIEKVCDEFIELHGDKVFADDKAIVTGLARLDTRRFLLVAHRKGRTTKERMAYNFGCAHPEGYRKALRKMRLAEKLHLPIVCLINTPGAYPGIGAEERGQAAAIAENILQMFSLKTPIVAVVIGEGGSGGALGIGVGDRVYMMEHSYYSVISPEGCAAILWKDGAKTPDAAEALKLTATDLAAMGLIDGIISEPAGGAHRAPMVAMQAVKRQILAALDELEALPVETLLHQRREKYRRAGALPGRFPVVT